MIFEGTCTALVTPYDKKLNIDYNATKKLIDFQLANGVDAILILGSTGENFAISSSQKQKFIPFVKNLLNDSCKLIVGAGSNQPEETIKLIKEAKSLGADCCLVQTPYFNKCTQNGIFSYFETICNNVDIPIIVYNIPSRSGVNIKPSTMIKISQLKNIAGLKEANGDINHILEMTNALAGKLPVYCGNDNLNHLFLCLGASGTISVTSNVFPKEISRMFKHREESLEISNRFFIFNNLMFCEPNPIPVKYALSKIGLIKNYLCPPLTKLEKSDMRLIDNELKKLGAIK